MGGVEEVMGLSYAFVFVKDDWMRVDLVCGVAVQEKNVHIKNEERGWEVQWQGD